MEISTLSEEEIFLFHEGTWAHSYRKMGAHQSTEHGIEGTRFNVWAPEAREVRLATDFNGWHGGNEPLTRLNKSGIWTGFFPNMPKGALYKYEIIAQNGERLLKADPYAVYAEVRPQTASRVWSLDGYSWQDEAWMRGKKAPYARPMNIYEVHLGSWRRHKDDTLLSYSELADQLVAYVADKGYTHLELLPLTEHPYDKSWGYQPTGYYAATSRYGEPQQLMELVDRCHQNGIGVILDWVPGHFAKDAHGLRRFDGSALFENDDPLIAEKPGWGTLAFDYGKPEVRNFLISNALFWFDLFHIDGLRVDAVTSILYHDFDKKPGQWRPNEFGGKEHLEGIAFLRQLNKTVFQYYPHALMMAEESHAYPGVTKAVDEGGLGFNYKWNMGWMNDTLSYAKEHFFNRKTKHNLLTFPIWYAWQDNHALPLSHDEVVHGKKSLLNKMPGSYEQKFAGLRLFYGYMMTHPGKKLLFMGGEFAQFIEWKDDAELDWLLLDYEPHWRMQAYTRRLNQLYAQEKALWKLDHDYRGFEWIEHEDDLQSVLSYRRLASPKGEALIMLCNFTDYAHPVYRIGVPSAGDYEIVLNSDEPAYGGSGFQAELLREGGAIASQRISWHDKKNSVELPLPPLSILILRRVKVQRSR
ncbi:1,4-alpha-glucan branching protein GlgB [Paenibacillus sp. Leaf72]|uniref:1,4-alpha-glucan branching protein GlgB n=1 Tax=Paenibacillus sp. Leaf72 TaxID=1736234 RepID=UPI0006F9E232|nr:1,4-alpha-glucan branching protein GlgB [Paenibacillus sp. Leaf72]KQO15802.1 1,4-alpha-glucan branching protein [Paenibacillus sp. Leaf72]